MMSRNHLHYRWGSRGRILSAFALVVLVLMMNPTGAAAQGDLRQPPEKGGLTYSLGMPPVYKGFAGFEIQSFRTSDEFTELAAYLNLGVGRDFGNPVVGLSAISLEGYGGYRGSAIDGGARASFLMPNIGFGVGADWNATEGDIVGLFRFDFPIRRGGVFGRGTSLAIRWLPARAQTLSIGINAPLWGRNLGATRPKSDNVRLDHRKPERMELSDGTSRLNEELENLSERVHWVARLSQPFAEHSGADPHQAMQPILSSIEAHIDSTDASFPEGHSLPAEIKGYHQSLENAFTIAYGEPGGHNEIGQLASEKARETLLDEVIFPYNRLLGQRKTNDSLLGLAAIAQTEFGSWILQQQAQHPDISDDQVRRVWYVFQTLCDLMEEMRKELEDRWEDSRFVWLPLEYGVKPDEHDTQEELDRIIERAVAQPFTPDNNVWYIINEQFQFEMARSVREAEDYHVLWIHDFRGKNGEGELDAVAAAQTLNYIHTLTARVREFDSTGKIPMYLILLDQHYFEINKGRIWLRLLSKPLTESVSFPEELAEWKVRLEQAQRELREAVDNSLMLNLGRSQYGEEWLERLIKVHVNITNPADPSFRSWHSAGIIPVPDGLMRDHRKIFFYDITEDDPYRGMAMFTGMGIGEHYTGPNWEDRAIMIQGPGALEAKTAARRLLLAQGFELNEIPYPLRPLPFSRTYDEAIAERTAEVPSEMGGRGKVMQMHNETGFHPKPINVAKAVLYNLMPSGSVLKVPDSLWQSYIYASLLGGSALRGCRVLVIAPTLDSAPSAASVTMARAHGLMGRLIVFSTVMDEAISRQGGLLKVGLYAPKQGVGDLAGRFRQAALTTVDWSDRIYGDNPAVMKVAANASAILDSLGYTEEYLTGSESEVQPKLHLKANFFASATVWNALAQRSEFADLTRVHIEYLAAQRMSRGADADSLGIREYPEALTAVWRELIKNLLTGMTPEEREEIIFYLTVGSTNMDYRSMVMDGEVMTLISRWQALYGFIDFIMLPGLCEWLETTEELDLYLPPPGGMTRTMAGFMRLSL